VFKITYYGDEILRKEAEDVVVNSETLEIAKNMVNAMKIYKGIGLAAPQVGISKKIIVIQLSDDSEPMFFFNVKILEKSEEENIMGEGCLSVPGIYEEITRPEKVKFSYTDANGDNKIVETDGVLARVIQHEADHLYGRLFIDYLSPLKKNFLKKKLVNIKKGIIPEDYIPEGKE